MATAAPIGSSPPTTPVRAARERTSSWPLMDRLAYYSCWAVGIGLCVIAVAIVAFMALKGVSYLNLKLLVQSPKPSLLQKQSGGFSDPIIGTALIALVGVGLAAPIGVALAVWLSEYRRPAWLARAVESAVEMVAGTPSVVLALFGLIVFAQGFLGFLSERAEDGSVTGESFLTAGAVMSALALPLVVASTREALAQLPDRLREASYALGKTRAQTVRHVLLPAVKPGIGTGVVLGMGRIIGDTAIIVLMLGGGQTLKSTGNVPILSTLRGVGSTLTNYVYYQSPAGEGNSPQKAYAAAFVLLLMVLALNALATRLTLSSAGRTRRDGRDLGRSALRGALGWSR